MMYASIEIIDTDSMDAAADLMDAHGSMIECPPKRGNSN